MSTCWHSDTYSLPGQHLFLSLAHISIQTTHLWNCMIVFSVLSKTNIVTPPKVLQTNLVALPLCHCITATLFHDDKHTYIAKTLAILLRLVIISHTLLIVSDSNTAQFSIISLMAEDSSWMQTHTEVAQVNMKDWSQQEHRPVSQNNHQSSRRVNHVLFVQGKKPIQLFWGCWHILCLYTYYTCSLTDHVYISFFYYYTQ